MNVVVISNENYSAILIVNVIKISIYGIGWSCKGCVFNESNFCTYKTRLELYRSVIDATNDQVTNICQLIPITIPRYGSPHRFTITGIYENKRLSIYLAKYLRRKYGTESNLYS